MSEEFKGARKYNGTASQCFRVKVIVNVCFTIMHFKDMKGSKNEINF